MRKSYLLAMVAAGMILGVPGCIAGGGLGSIFIEGGISLAISLILALINGSVAAA